MKYFVRFILLCAALTCLSAAAHSQEFVTVKVHLDQTMAAKSVTDSALECTKDPICKAALDAAAAYIGVDSSLITSAVAQISQSRDGEEGRYEYRLPAGYQYCRSTVSPTSVNPATGDRASVLGVSAFKQGLGAYAWTPRQGVFGGRSWVEADFSIVGVQDALADQYRVKGTCKPNTPSRVLLSCRGASGVNHGMPHCSTIQD